MSRPIAVLTVLQKETLELALDQGYYDVPKKASLHDLAADLGVSHQALSERLRRAHRNLAAAAVAVPEDDDPTLWASSNLSGADVVHRDPRCPAFNGRESRIISRETADWHGLDDCPKCPQRYALTDGGENR